MHRILDIHTHRTAPQFEAVVNVSPENFHPLEGQYYSLGIHPWATTEEITQPLWEALEKAAAHPAVVAIGECGVDLLKGGPLYRQMLVMKRQAELAEKLRKPLIIHDVHAHDVIIGMKKDFHPRQKWMIHGFRGKQTVAEMFLRAGFMLSFAPKFNPAALLAVPEDALLAETDDSGATIAAVIASLSAVRGKDLTDVIARNSNVFLSSSTTEEDADNKTYR